MYRSILFAVTDDEALSVAIPAVAAYAGSGTACVHVLHVERIDPAVPDGAHSTLVDTVVARLRGQGIDADGELRTVTNNEIAEVIATATTKAEADLVVLGSRGRSDLVGLILGSVSHRVAEGLDVPTLVIRSGGSASRPQKLLVAVDGSAASDESVKEAAALASRFGAQVRVLHVQQIFVVQGAAIVEPDSEAQAIVDRALAELSARGVKASGETVPGHRVASAIVTAAERFRADLVVLGSRRPPDMSGLLFGSVGHQVIHDLRCPVLLARRLRAAELVP